MTDVSDYRLVLHRCHVFGGDNVEVARCSDEDIGLLHHLLEPLHLVAFHRRLQRADGIDFGDDDAASLSTQRLRTTLADFTVTANNGHLTTEHHIGRPCETIRQGVPASVDVVELTLGNRIVDVDGRKEEASCFGHLVQPMHAGRCLLAYTLDVLSHHRPTPRVAFHFGTKRIQYDAPLFGLGFRVEYRNRSRRFELRTLVYEQRRVSAVVHQ